MSREFSRERGFLTFAQNGKDDYLRMAYALALSLKATQKTTPYLAVAITPGMIVPPKYKEVFDDVVYIPWLDDAQTSTWKLENEWKAYHITPYRETVKLDADMLFMNEFEPSFNLMARQDVCASSAVETYRGEVATSDAYRKVFTANDLPNAYTALMFFRYSDLAEEVFKLAEIIFQNWQKFFADYLVDEARPEYVSTDVVFALAMKLTGFPEECVSDAVRFVHMKSALQNWPEGVSETWTDHVQPVLHDKLSLTIGRYRQILPVHYHLKAVLTDEIIATYEKALGL